MHGDWGKVRRDVKSIATLKFPVAIHRQGSAIRRRHAEVDAVIQTPRRWRVRPRSPASEAARTSARLLTSGMPVSHHA